MGVEGVEPAPPAVNPVGEGASLNQTRFSAGEGEKGGWEPSKECQSCFALKKFRFPRRLCGYVMQTFQAKGVGWAKPCFPCIVCEMGSSLVR